MTYIDHYEALSSPESAEHFARTLAALCREAGAERFIAVHLRGADQSQVVRVLHNGSAMAAGRLDAERHPSLDRLLTEIRSNRVPRAIGGLGGDVLDVDGYDHGVAALAAAERTGLLLIFCRQSPEVRQEEMFDLMASVQLVAQYGVGGLALLPKRVCQLRERELECLTYFLANMGVKETARALGISGRTVEGHLDRARVRCGVDATIAAAMMALNEGWITMAQIRLLNAGPAVATG